MCYELVILQNQVRVQSDPAGRLVISGEPEHEDNPWGVAPFKKVNMPFLFVMPVIFHARVEYMKQSLQHVSWF